eukprot:COSAG02_NODE_321_length_24780_cov_11.623962_21_plen_164_part_00
MLLHRSVDSLQFAAFNSDEWLHAGILRKCQVVVIAVASMFCSTSMELFGGGVYESLNVNQPQKVLNFGWGLIILIVIASCEYATGIMAPFHDNAFYLCGSLSVVLSLSLSLSRARALSLSRARALSCVLPHVLHRYGQPCCTPNVQADRTILALHGRCNCSQR